MFTNEMTVKFVGLAEAGIIEQHLCRFGFSTRKAEKPWHFIENIVCERVWSGVRVPFEATIMSLKYLHEWPDQKDENAMWLPTILGELVL
jgi:hypothetical protein